MSGLVTTTLFRPSFQQESRDGKVDRRANPSAPSKSPPSDIILREENGALDHRLNQDEQVDAGVLEYDAAIR
jgi:hypothetical protein